TLLSIGHLVHKKSKTPCACFNFTKSTMSPLSFLGAKKASPSVTEPQPYLSCTDAECSSNQRSLRYRKCVQTSYLQPGNSNQIRCQSYLHQESLMLLYATLYLR